MIYFDTSYIARLYLEDPGWEKVRKLAATDQIACSLHGRAETVAALHRRFREGAITERDMTTLIHQFEIDGKAGAFQWFPISPLVIDRLVALYAKLPATVHLRAADALHLSCAVENGCKEIYSNDTQLLAASIHFGISGKNVV